MRFSQSALVSGMRRTLEVRQDPRLFGLVLEALPPGPGGRNHLFAASSGRRSYVIKVRRDANDTAEREAWALRRLRGTLAPRLISWWPGNVAGEPSIQSPRCGGCLVMARVSGDVPSAVHLDLAARTVAELHSSSPQRGPELLCPSGYGSLLRYAADLGERVVRRKELSSSKLTTLTNAIRSLGSRNPPDFPSVRALCHGDLRWHNMRYVDHGLKLLDLELAGLGDPAVDIALMVARTPLSDSEATEFLSVYQAHRSDETLRARYAWVLPVVSLVSALSAVLGSGPGADEELERALSRPKPGRDPR